MSNLVDELKRKLLEIVLIAPTTGLPFQIDKVVSEYSERIHEALMNAHKPSNKHPHLRVLK